MNKIYRKRDGRIAEVLEVLESGEIHEIILTNNAEERLKEYDEKVLEMQKADEEAKQKAKEEEEKKARAEAKKKAKEEAKQKADEEAGKTE